MQDQHWGFLAYHLELSARLFPFRAQLDVSDLNAGRDWSLENFLIDLRSDGSAEAASFPADKQWASNMADEYRGDLTLGRSTIENHS